MGQLPRWAFLSALLFVTAILSMYLAIVAYARSTVGLMMGRGPSVSEEVELIAVIYVASGLVYRRIACACRNHAILVYRNAECA